MDTSHSKPEVHYPQINRQILSTIHVILWFKLFYNLHYDSISLYLLHHVESNFNKDEKIKHHWKWYYAKMPWSRPYYNNNNSNNNNNIYLTKCPCQQKPFIYRCTLKYKYWIIDVLTTRNNIKQKMPYLNFLWYDVTLKREVVMVVGRLIH